MPANMSPVKNPMPSQDPALRAHNFEEVALGYDEQTALAEAARCLNCKAMPCVAGCPVNVHIPAFIAKVREGDFEAAYQIIAQSSSLPAVCGRVCPQESQCEAHCVRGNQRRTRGYRPAGALRGGLAQRPQHGCAAASGVQRPPGCGGGLRPLGPDLRR